MPPTLIPSVLPADETGRAVAAQTPRRPGSIRGAAVAGSFWVIAGYGSTQLFRLAGNLVLAWLLFPAAFGLMAIVNVVLHGLTMFSDVGIGPSIIRSRRGESASFLNTAWTIQIIRGFALWFCACLLAWPAAWFFARSDPMAWQLTTLLPVAGFAAVIAGFNSTKLFTLNRQLRFRRLTAIDVASQVAGVMVMIGWALVDRSIWALVAGGLAAAGVKMVLTHEWIDGHGVRPGWDGDCARELYRFGKWVFASTALAFGALHVDKLVLGTVLTLGELGIYAIAFAFAKVAMHISTRQSETVLFPVYAKYRDDPPRMVDVAIRSREAVLWCGAAVCLCFAVGSPIFFDAVYDPRYASAGGTAQWLTLYMWSSILLLSMNRIPLALGNSRALFLSNLFRCSGLLFAVAGYALAELPGFIVGLALGPALTHLLLLREIPMRRLEIMWQSVRFTAVAGGYGAAAVAAELWAQRSGDLLFRAAAVATLAAIPALIGAVAVIKQIRHRPAREAPALVAGAAG